MFFFAKRRLYVACRFGHNGKTLTTGKLTDLREC